MSIRVMSLVWDSNLEPSKKLIMLYFADRASDEGDNVYPSISTAAKKSGLGRATVIRCTQGMVRDGLLILEGKTKYGTNRYRIALDAVKNYVRKTKAQETGDDQLCPDDVPFEDESSGSETENRFHGDTSITMKPVSPGYPGGSHHDTGGGITMRPDSSINHQINHQSTDDQGSSVFRHTDAQKKGDILDGILAYQKDKNALDLSDYPEDLHPYLKGIFRLWGLRPPRRSNDRAAHAHWIKSTRSVRAVCAEFGVDLLLDYFQIWSGNQTIRLTISGPWSLVNLLSAEAGKKRTGQKTTWGNFKPVNTEGLQP